MKATITFDDQGGITIEGDDEAVKRAYEIWDPYKTGKYSPTSELVAALEDVRSDPNYCAIDLLLRDKIDATLAAHGGKK